MSMVSMSTLQKCLLKLLLLPLVFCLPGIAAAALPVWLPVTEDGLYRLGYQELGLDTGPLRQEPASSRLALSRDGLPVAIFVFDGGDGSFGPGDYLVFYGQSMARSDRRYKYTGEAVYRLGLSDVAALRMEVSRAYSGVGGRIETSFLSTLHAEQNSAYWQQMPNGVDKDHWFWGNRSAHVTLPFWLSRFEPLSKLPMRVRVHVHGFIDQPHSTQVSLNGQVLGARDWSGAVPHEMVFPLMPQQLQEGNNTLTILDQSGAGDLLYIDSLDIDYGQQARASQNLFEVQLGSDFQQYQVLADGFSSALITAYDISDPVHVRRLENVRVQTLAQGFRADLDGLSAAGHYLIVADPAYKTLTPREPAIDDLRATDNGADYIIITTPLMFQSIEPLRRLRAAQGMRTRVVTMSAIYDDFADGHKNPEAVRDFLRYAQRNWQSPGPSYVLLAGDGHFDYRDYFATHEPNLVPPRLIETAEIGEVPSDHWFGMFAPAAGASMTSLPRLHIGRIPAKTPADMRFVVDKILKYEAGMRGEWSSRLLVVGGDDQGVNGDQRFTQVSNDWLRYVPATFAAVNISPVNVSIAEYPVLKADLLRELNGKGAGFVSYFGHGTIDGWLASDLNVGGNALELLTSADVGKELLNHRAFPFIAAFNCLNGLFSGTNDGRNNAFPGLPGSNFSQPLAEALLVREDAGAIAMWTSSSLSYPSDQVKVGDALYQALFAQTQGRRLGQLLNDVMATALKQGVNPEVLSILSLFGDPAMTLSIKGVSTGSVGATVPESSGGADFVIFLLLLLLSLARFFLPRNKIIGESV